METKNMKNENKKEIKHKNWGDILFGIFLIVFGFIFFIIATFTIIISKIKRIPEDKLEQFPNWIQFLIKDTHYCFCIVLSIPLIIVISTIKRIVFLNFRHIY